jgi:hypothetical protein
LCIVDSNGGIVHRGTDFWGSQAVQAVLDDGKALHDTLINQTTASPPRAPDALDVADFLKPGNGQLLSDLVLLAVFRILTTVFLFTLPNPAQPSWSRGEEGDPCSIDDVSLS